MDRSRIALLLVLVGFVALLGLALRWYLDQDTVPLFDAASWHLVNDDAGTILWQKDLSCFKDTRVPNGAVSVVGDQVIFHQDCLPGIAVLKAVDAVTGQQVWWAKSPSSSQLVALADGVINVEDGTRLVKYDLSGREVWRSADFPAQSILRVTGNANQLTVIRSDAIDVLATQTGQIEATKTNTQYLLGVSDGYVQLNKTGLEVVYPGAVAQGFDLPQVLTVPRESLWLDVRDDMLSISPEAGVVHAYDLASAQSLWTIETQALSVPILADDRLYLYTPANTLDSYDLQTGERINSLALEHAGGYTGRVHLAWTGKSVVLAFPASHEIIAITLR